MALEPGRCIGEQREGGVALRKAVLTKSFNLTNQAFGEFCRTPSHRKSLEQLVAKRSEIAFLAPRGHRSSHLVRLARRKACGNTASCITCS
jgi:hypothetical protein